MKTLPLITTSIFAVLILVSCNNTSNDDVNHEDLTGHHQMDDGDGLFSDWDMDKNDGISRTEFDDAFNNHGAFSRWDVDHDGIVDSVEYGDRMFGRMDADKNDRLTEDERVNIWKDESNEGVDWDRDGNKEMDREEFRQIFTMKTDYSDWDENADGKLDKTEYTNRMYKRMDTNNDGIISKTEFNEEELN